MRERLAGGLFKGGDHFEDGSGVAGAEIVGFEARFQTLDGSEMTFCKVDNMNVITKAGAIFGIVIVTIYGEFGNFALINTHDNGHEIIGNAVWIFAEGAGRMIADRIEVT